MSTFGEKINGLRKAQGMTQDALAEQLGVTAQAVSKWERDESMPDVALLPPLARTFGVTIDSLFGREPETRYLPAAQRNFDEMILRINVDGPEDKVKVNIPLALVKVVLEVGASMDSVSFGGADLSKIDFDAIVRLVESGAVGKLVEIETGDGETVVIEVV